MGGEDADSDEGPHARRVQTQKQSWKEVFPTLAQSRRLPCLVADLISQYLGESAQESVSLTRAQVTCD